MTQSWPPVSSAGIEPVIVDLRDINQAREALKNNKDIKMMYLETPANPTIQCVDLEALTKIAKEYQLIVARRLSSPRRGPTSATRPSAPHGAVPATT